MNTQFYNDLLRYSSNLIYKYPFLPLNKFDLVHECWDFKTEDKYTVVKQINKYFFDELKKQHIPFSFFKRSPGDSIPIELIGIKKKLQKQKVVLFNARGVTVFCQRNFLNFKKEIDHLGILVKNVYILKTHWCIKRREENII